MSETSQEPTTPVGPDEENAGNPQEPSAPSSDEPTPQEPSAPDGEE